MVIHHELRGGQLCEGAKQKRVRERERRRRRRREGDSLSVKWFVSIEAPGVPCKVWSWLIYH